MNRFFDILFSLIGVILFFPFFVYFLTIIWLHDKKNPLYFAPRSGKDGVVFKMLKLRSMMVGADKQGINSIGINDNRITPIGKMIRKYKLDEFPQLWNVLIGDMTFVGPRPIVDEEILKYGDSIIFYKKCKPGLTGLWQIKRTPSTNFKIRAKFDKEYYENISFIFDVKIMLSTLKIFLKAKGDWLDK